MSEQHRDEKAEKQEEKDEKERQEKNWDEKWRRDPLNMAVWAALLIWAGLVLLAGNLGFLAPLEPLAAWQLVFIGAGVIVLLEAAVRLLVPAYRRGVGGTVLFAFFLIIIGAGGWLGWSVIAPLGLIAIGLAILLRRIV